LENIIIAFVTGLTTGGLSCLAVQGGLLASSLTNQIEKDFQTQAGKTSRHGKNSQAVKRSDLGLPILAFLVAKLFAYTLLGLLLGALGQMFQLSPITRAILQVGIGIFMLGSALRMFNVHPIFRYFAFEPPAFLRRKLRQTANNSDGSSLASPIFLGLLTVLIPCGVAQAMMAVALGTGNPLQGAALMFAFTLGTSPVFFAVSYFATKLGSKLEKNFMRFTAALILILAVVTIDSGLTLMGSPLSLQRIWKDRKSVV
jgi:sulfite exporter TauE/SafE